MEEIKIIVRGFDLNEILSVLQDQNKDKNIEFGLESDLRFAGAGIPPDTIIAVGANLISALIPAILYYLEKKKLKKIKINDLVIEYPSGKDVTIIAEDVRKSGADKIIISNEEIL